MFFRYTGESQYKASGLCGVCVSRQRWRDMSFYKLAYVLCKTGICLFLFRDMSCRFSGYVFLQSQHMSFTFWHMSFQRISICLVGKADMSFRKAVICLLKVSICLYKNRDMSCEKSCGISGSVCKSVGKVCVNLCGKSGENLWKSTGKIWGKSGKPTEKTVCESGKSGRKSGRKPLWNAPEKLCVFRRGCASKRQKLWGKLCDAVRSVCVQSSGGCADPVCGCLKKRCAICGKSLCNPPGAVCFSCVRCVFFGCVFWLWLCDVCRSCVSCPAACTRCVAV